MRDPQKGFALPFALVAIAAMAIIAAIGFRAVSDSTSVMNALQADIATERALVSAEAEAVFVYLTSAPVSGGIASGQAAAAADPVFDVNPVDPNERDPSQYWRADGQARSSGTPAQPVRVVYRDAAGLAPITSLPEDTLAAFLRKAGFEREDAPQFAARIGDYQDDDVNRRFRGAERADYRLFGAPPPTNSPLRAYQETASVLGVPDSAPPGFWTYLAEYGRFGRGGGFKPAFAPPEIADLFPERGGFALNPDPAEVAEAGDLRPSATARFLLETPIVNGLTRRRAVEIMRTAAAADVPFRREWIYDKADANDGSAITAIDQEGLAQVFQP